LEHPAVLAQLNLAWLKLSWPQAIVHTSEENVPLTLVWIVQLAVCAVATHFFNS
jgi:hypothetical protein